MEKSSTPDPVLQELDAYARKQTIPLRYIEILKQFYLGYREALHVHGVEVSACKDLFNTYLRLIEQQCLEPYIFEPFHVRKRTPFDHYSFGLDLFRPLIDRSLSTVEGLEYLQHIRAALEKGDNVIFCANHQIEGDPQVIALLLEELSPQIAENCIFVAGERVTTDPLAVPLSLGCNLLCIYSKRYIDFPPEHKLKKQLYNKRTMELMSELLSEGGKAIYVAPSGGRDRPNATGVFEVAPFDPQSIEMLYLMASRAGHPTHFYPLALKTYALLPPPESIQVELGEVRLAKRSGSHLAFGPEFDMHHFPGSTIPSKHQRREARAQYMWKSVDALYQKFP